MRVWVTGGAGFLGSHLCEAFLDRGAKVRCIDNLSSGRIENLRTLDGDANFLFVCRDVCDVWPLPMQHDKHPDVVYHMASLASPVDYARDPVATIEANTLGTMNVLKFAKQTGARVVYVSTSEVYGNPREVPQYEDTIGSVEPTSPRAAYCLSKMAGEALVYSHHRQFGTEVCVVRIFNTYGPRMRSDDGRAVPTFIRQALAGESLTIHGNGKQTRSFCYVDDTVRALLRCAEPSRGLLWPVNVGSDVELTVGELAEQIQKLVGSSSQVVYAPRFDDDPDRRRPSLVRASKMLDWAPEVSLREGLLKTIEYARTA